MPNHGCGRRRQLGCNWRSLLDAGGALRRRGGVARGRGMGHPCRRAGHRGSLARCGGYRRHCIPMCRRRWRLGPFRLLLLLLRWLALLRLGRHAAGGLCLAVRRHGGEGRRLRKMHGERLTWRPAAGSVGTHGHGRCTRVRRVHARGWSMGAPWAHHHLGHQNRSWRVSRRRAARVPRGLKQSRMQRGGDLPGVDARGVQRRHLLLDLLLQNVLLDSVRVEQVRPWRSRRRPQGPVAEVSMRRPMPSWRRHRCHRNKTRRRTRCNCRRGVAGWRGRCRWGRPPGGRLARSRCSAGLAGLTVARQPRGARRSCELVRRRVSLAGAGAGAAQMRRLAWHDRGRGGRVEHRDQRLGSVIHVVVVRLLWPCPTLRLDRDGGYHWHRPGALYRGCRHRCLRREHGTLGQDGRSRLAKRGTVQRARPRVVPGAQGRIISTCGLGLGTALLQLESELTVPLGGVLCTCAWPRARLLYGRANTAGGQWLVGGNTTWVWLHRRRVIQPAVRHLLQVDTLLLVVVVQDDMLARARVVAPHAAAVVGRICLPPHLQPAAVVLAALRLPVQGSAAVLRAAEALVFTHGLARAVALKLVVVRHLLPRTDVAPRQHHDVHFARRSVAPLARFCVGLAARVQQPRHVALLARVDVEPRLQFHQIKPVACGTAGPAQRVQPPGDLPPVDDLTHILGDKGTSLDGLPGPHAPAPSPAGVEHAQLGQRPQRKRLVAAVQPTGAQPRVARQEGCRILAVGATAYQPCASGVSCWRAGADLDL
mmetsp:Transcript_39727/g.101584  ORF Transcript_39727/g.101584 Transcript_39727/m.101584 type:complete len:763 (-) Transcript_39727:1036-3324(-)